MTYEEWLEMHPIPDKWTKRLERDEVEIAAERKQAR